MESNQKSLPKNLSRWQAILPAVLPAVFVSTLLMVWQRKVNSELPDPYLDEVFHVRQAQAYWAHRWRQWDPKITTPPGLYLCSYIIGTILFLIRLRPAHPSASFYRYGNSIALFNMLQQRLRQLMEFIWNRELLSRPGKSPDSASGNGREMWEKNLTVLNICLFPPLFFFSGLYYTDLAALLMVLKVYYCDLSRDCERNAHLSRSDKAKSRNSKVTPLSWGDFSFLIFGLLALLFRQTNIFWVAIFLGELRVVRTLHGRTASCQSTGVLKIARGSWELQQLYDPPVSEASSEDYLKTLVSLGISALAHLIPIIAALIPYLFFLGAFGLFVLWNGGVVLGHKEFHIAGLHLPQMLYIWPYFIFFSWPIFLIPFATAMFQRPTMKILPNIKTAAIFIPLMLLTVHLNTIVHPFTLADNRHYVFYVFRILLRHPLIKYLATPIYFACAWAVLTTLGVNSHLPSRNTTSMRSQHPPESSAKSYKSNVETEPNNFRQVRLSFVIIWLIATSLSLITAPLVEPRYFLIPWVIWRLHVLPSATITGKNPDRSSGNSESCDRFLKFLPLVLESTWYIVINMVTGYMFLYRGFEWPQEPGLVQRFMW
ncbi:hypothetical protein AJ79_03974 [Helicocarpus griseus UAMH5409]|uniref:Dol-P-Glc:Glc(2)Man(9)GlcNAc(2)-PP-Dol alpha-1,2-glucosyltransferase n=1 Tax=Helicocarpus griseus UAMH5409 TaxID=1447875 RepID=A0A2B7XM88_9EURO|nr:hypothetical protein AJ79_03974 [Helicocarpus griseus UAMH5409]